MISYDLLAYKQDTLATDSADFRKHIVKKGKTMNTIIDAGSAQLVGLQIDTLSKYLAGQITLGQWERFNNLSPGDREARFSDWKKLEHTAPVEPTEKFALLVDLGIITVPDDYDHATHLTLFRERHQSGEKKSFNHYKDHITDKNFPNPTRILKPGDRLRVRAFKQVVGGTTTSEERLAFLATQKAIHTGAQGASLVFDQKRDQLPKRKWYASFDEKDRLWADTHGNHGVPHVLCDSDGDSKFCLGCFEDVWGVGHAFLCMTDVA